MASCILVHLEQLARLSQRPYTIAQHILALSRELVICMLLTFSDAIAR